MKIRLGTRGSALALWQAHYVRERLLSLHPGLDIELVVIRTTGDRFLAASLPEMAGKGVFVKEIEQALKNSGIDLAVHSLKDLPIELPAGLTLAAFPSRDDPSDALVCRVAATLESLPKGALVGTGSLRRLCQIRRRRPDLVVQEIRGNVDTRLAKVRDGQFDAVVLAAAGLRRLGRESEISEKFSPTDFLPAPGQGCLVVEARQSDACVGEIVCALTDADSQSAALAERSLLGALGGGCRVPIGAYARKENGKLRLKAFVADPNDTTWIEAEASGGDPVQLGCEVAEHLRHNGATALLERRG